MQSNCTTTNQPAKRYTARDLFQAIADNNFPRVRTIVQSGDVDIESTTSVLPSASGQPDSYFKKWGCGCRCQKVPPLLEAARRGYPDIVEILLQAGANIKALAQDKQTPLHIASQLNEVDVVEAMLQAGAKVNAKQDEGDTPLHHAAFWGFEQIAQLLIKHRATPNARNNIGVTPLCWAASRGHIQIVRLLIQHGANTNSPDIQNSTPLHSSAEKGYSEIAALLVQHGARLEIRDKWGHTPLLLAARAGYLEIVKTLVEYGACIYSKGQRTPLGEAYQCGHQEVVDFLSSFSKKSGKSKLRQQTTNRGGNTEPTSKSGNWFHLFVVLAIILKSCCF